MKPIIEASGLCKTYHLYQKPSDRFFEALPFCRRREKKNSGSGVKPALQDVSFSISQGEAVGFIGSNGAGKSTLLKMIAGVTKPDSGTLLKRGKVSALLELGAGFHPDYTGIENVLLTGRIMGISREEMERRLPGILEFAGIGEYVNQPVRTYSSGMFARLAFASATSVDADILIVDEALSVGDTFFQNRCFHRFSELKERGTTLLLVSHDLETIRRMTEKCYWIEDGRIRMEGESREVCNAYAAEIHRKENQDFRRRYSGLSGKEEGFGGAAPACIPETAGDIPEWNPDVLPHLTPRPGDILHDEVNILSCFFEDASGRIVQEIKGGEACRLSVVFKTKKEIRNCIVGYVLQNKKGVSIVNSNTVTTPGGRPFRLEPGTTCRVTFSLVFPRLYEDEYLVDCAVADGVSTMDNEMLTWRYAAVSIMVKNDRPCLAMLDVQAEVSVSVLGQGDVSFWDRGTFRFVPKWGTARLSQNKTYLCPILGQNETSPCPKTKRPPVPKRNVPLSQRKGMI